MATFDARKNFAKVTVSTGYDASATTIVLGSGHGARLPLPSADGEFNLVWWNNTDYGDPTDDPNREIVRCTARSTDTLTVVRAQEGEAAAIKNIAGKTYRMALTITKKVIDDIIDNVGASSTISVAQATHGLVVGDVVRNTAIDDTYVKANAGESIPAIMDSLSEASFSSGDAYYGATSFGQSFTGNGNNVTSCKAYLQRLGSPTGTITAHIYAHSGTFGTSSIPTGSSLVASTSVDVSTIATSYALYTFTFSSPITLVNGTKYCVVFTFTGTASSGNWITAGYGVGAHAGNRCRYTSSWVADSTLDLLFYVYGSDSNTASQNSEVVGIVTQVVDSGNFVITTSGMVDAAGAVPAGTAGTVLFLSPTTAGTLTTTEPTTAGQISKPLAIIQNNDDTMVFFNWRGALISDVELPTQTYITVKMGTEADGDDNRTFSLTTGSFTAGKYLSVYKNGQLQEESATADYVTSGTTIAYFNAAVLDTDKITLVVRSYTVENMEDPLTTAGDIIYRNATVPARLPVGTATYRLAVNSGATAPEWVKPDMVLPVAIADQAFAGITETGTAGATLAFGDLCYFQAADSRWELADANLSAGYDKKLGMCVLAAAADGSATNLLLIGKIRADSKFPTMTIGSAVYMSETAGAIVVAQPTTADACIRVVGFANTADELYFNPSPDYIIHT